MEPVFLATPEELRAWLEEHHETAPELVVGLHKKHTGKQGLSWEQLVDEVLCFGWIDGQGRRIDDERHQIRITPRRPGSIWSTRNIARMEALRAEGRVHPAGEAAYAERREERSGVYSHERDSPAQLAPEQEARFRAHPEAWRWFLAQAPSYQQAAIHHVMRAKRDETRARRLADLIVCSGEGLRIKQLRR
jgi:uncharacterized protein YdeI (YjbR/CyaY-like superfamily)